MPRVSVGFGLGAFPFDTARGFWRWVDLCEAGGVDSIWQSDRLVGSEPVLESMALMAALAGRTSRLKFGMSVVSLAFRDPGLLAKQCATIDVLSEGRLLPAFGIGNPAAREWAVLHLDERTRGARTDEALEIIRRLWTEDDVSFEGKHFSISHATIAPKPVQPEMPLWIGGSSEPAIKRTARVGTGWQSTIETPEEIAPVIAKINAAAAATGRTIDPGHFGAGFAFHFGRADDPGVAETAAQFQRLAGGRGVEHFAVIGEPAAVVERIWDYVAAGASKLILRPMTRGDDALIAQTRRLIEEVLPQIEERNRDMGFA